MKPNLGLFIGSEFHARSLTESKVFNLLVENYELKIFATSNICKYFKQIDLPYEIIEILNNKNLNKLFSLHLKLGTIRYMKRSRSYKFRINRYIFGDYYPKQNFWSKTLSVLKIASKSMIILFRYILSKKIFYLMVQKIYLKKIEQLLAESIFHTTKFDLLISWCQTTEPTALAPIVFGRKYSVPSMVVVDNWDNLSSKSVFPIEPDSLVCFGLQSEEFARKIQQFKSAKIFAIGSARFEIYRRYILGGPSTVPSDYLYAGSSIAMEDEEVLEILHNYSKAQGLDQKFRYRRHPYPQGPKINLANLKLRFSTIHFEEINALESLEQTKESLLKSKILIAMPTTFLLEGLLCGIPTILLSFKSTKIRTSSRIMLENLEHLKGISSIKGLHVATSATELLGLIELTSQMEKFNYLDEIQYYVNWSSTTYGDQLISAVDKTISFQKPIN
jgi:hypothetical protein